MLHPHPHKKSKKLEAPSALETPEQIRDSVEQDYALGIRARRRQEEIKTRRAEFELTRDKIYLALELIAILVLLIISVASFLAGNPGLALGALGGASLSGLIAVLHRPSKPESPS